MLIHNYGTGVSDQNQLISPLKEAVAEESKFMWAMVLKFSGLAH